MNAQPEADLDALLSFWVGGKQPITILDLSGVPAPILTDLVGALLRLLFDALSWARLLPEGGRRRPVLFVLEEAHAYLSTEGGGAARAARRLVKEGRKYGLGAMVISQRPTEIDSTILSQCGTIFAMRLSNATDRARVMATAADSLEGLFAMLPALRTGEAIVVGEAVPLPLRAAIAGGSKRRRPDSHDPPVYDPEGKRGWNQARSEENYARAVERWRREDPRGGGSEGDSE